MSDIIKIVYNWIGPNGAISNDEPPSIFDFAAISGNSQVSTSRYFSDHLWHRLFQNDSKFEMAASYTIKEEDKFIYPFCLRWRINFLQYFYNDNGLIEWAHVPGHVIHYVREKNGYFLIDCSIEAYTDNQHFDVLHSYFSSLGIPLNKIIYLTGCMNVDEVYESYCRNKNVPNDANHRLTLISYPSSQSVLSRQVLESPEVFYDLESVPEKLFLSWNRRYRPHRIALMLLLQKNNLIDRSYISLNKVSDENSSDTFIDHARGMKISNINDNIVQLLDSRLPLILDNQHDIAKMCADPEFSTRKFYQNSLFSVVTETNFLETNSVTLTEKSFKPIREKHPFIIVGVPGALAAMRRMGYKTFSDFWPEDYDEITNDSDRLVRIVEIIKMIAEWSEDQILEFKKNVVFILNHNYNNLKTDTTIQVVSDIYDKVQGKIESKNKMKKILVCGAGGFIGSHLVKYLKRQGHYVIGADLKKSEYQDDETDEFVIIDLRYQSNVEDLIQPDIDEVYQLAADMGGAGYIFTGQHDADIMRNNTLINLNILEVMKNKNIKKVFFSSSACIYPKENQADSNYPICTENSAYPADPDSEYGWEKLYSERLYLAYAKNYGIDVRIARFHNIFGPYGAWNDGREKAPAAICRKIAESDDVIEIWGDGEQTRSFLFIDDALIGIDKIMNGHYQNPLNLGNENMITINELVHIVAKIAGKNIKIKNINGPTGVRGRTSDNNLILEKLHWKPEENLFAGLTKTYHWILSMVKA